MSVRMAVAATSTDKRKGENKGLWGKQDEIHACEADARSYNKSKSSARATTIQRFSKSRQRKRSSINSVPKFSKQCFKPQRAGIPAMQG